ncbi:hypothetical protein GCM10009766_04360 [Microcella frigidaquae]
MTCPVFGAPGRKVWNGWAVSANCQVRGCAAGGGVADSAGELPRVSSPGDARAGPQNASRRKAARSGEKWSPGLLRPGYSSVTAGGRAAFRGHPVTAPSVSQITEFLPTASVHAREQGHEKREVRDL